MGNQFGLKLYFDQMSSLRWCTSADMFYAGESENYLMFLVLAYVRATGNVTILIVQCTGRLRMKVGRVVY